MRRTFLRPVVAMIVASTACCAGLAVAGDQPQWGQRHTRNMISAETGLATDFDIETGRNIRWSAPLGDNAYASPVIANGRVFIGANNEAPRDPRIAGDRAVMLCLNEADGTLLWQLAVPRIGGDDYLDWPLIGMCTAPTVEGNRAYGVTNRFEVVCFDVEGLANGNDGPFMDEGTHMVETGQPALALSPTDADIVWLFDMPAEVGMYPHDGAHSAILIDGDYLYLNTGNGVDNTHKVIRKPDAPALIVLDKATGKLIAQDAERIGPRTFHATWSPPALGAVNGEKRLVFGGPDGVCYGVRALAPGLAPDTSRVLERIWRFDCDPTAPKENLAEWLSNRKEGPSSIESMPVFLEGRVYVTVGGDVWWGKEQSWLMCIDGAREGELTEAGPLWSYPMAAHCTSTPAVHDGLIFIGDDKGNAHCVDAASGEGLWSHKMRGDIWGSALVADGKVYIGSRGKELCVFSASRDLNVLATMKLDAAMASTPVAANGVLYISTLKTLYAIAPGAGPQ
ncbi:MAG: PQQ-binding-like beta-propeller repeat protein [Candidatus Hydrogenedentes bacterium]|nr:PQQ-binding-like beta-propeller repeat protein [Candidatus Hydrogenedentota bacterium]